MAEGMTRQEVAALAAIVEATRVHEAQRRELRRECEATWAGEKGGKGVGKALMREATTLLPVARDDSHELQVPALRAFTSMCRADEDFRARFCRFPRGIEVLALVARNAKNPEAKAHAFKALALLADVEASLLQVPGLVGAAVIAVQGREPRILETAALSLLDALSHFKENCVRLFRTPGLVSALVEVMRDPMEEKENREHALSVLTWFGGAPEEILKLLPGIPGLVPAVVNLSREEFSDSSVKNRTAAFLARLLVPEGNRELLLKCGAADVIVKTILELSSSADHWTRIILEALESASETHARLLGRTPRVMHSLAQTLQSSNREIRSRSLALLKRLIELDSENVPRVCSAPGVLVAVLGLVEQKHLVGPDCELAVELLACCAKDARTSAQVQSLPGLLDVMVREVRGAESPGAVVCSALFVVHSAALLRGPASLRLFKRYPDLARTAVAIIQKYAQVSYRVVENALLVLQDLLEVQKDALAIWAATPGLLDAILVGCEFPDSRLQGLRTLLRLAGPAEGKLKLAQDERVIKTLRKAWTKPQLDVQTNAFCVTFCLSLSPVAAQALREAFEARGAPRVPRDAVVLRWCGALTWSNLHPDQDSPLEVVGAALAVLYGMIMHGASFVLLESILVKLRSACERLCEYDALFDEVLAWYHAALVRVLAQALWNDHAPCVVASLKALVFFVRADGPLLASSATHNVLVSLLAVVAATRVDGCDAEDAALWVEARHESLALLRSLSGWL